MLPTQFEATSINVADLAASIRQHRLYALVREERSLQLFMRSHVFAVLDFQSLLKALQRELTCVDVPWLPTADPGARRLINEIVLDEESDDAPGGGYLSHFELYLRAMHECGADTEPIDRFVAALRAGKDANHALRGANASAGVAAFVLNTMEIARSGATHQMAAAFSFGREDIIPEMFEHLVEGLAEFAPERWAAFGYYLRRHIQADGERHGPLSKQLTLQLCGNDPTLAAEAQASARACLRARLGLWDQIATEITART